MATTATISTLAIERAVSADLPEVLALGRCTWRATFEPIVGRMLVEQGLARFWGDDTIAAEIAAGQITIARDCDGLLVGMGSVRTDARTVFLARLYVSPERQRLGAGAALLASVVTLAASRPVELTVLSTNARARSFYERAGFRAVGVEPDPAGWPDQLRMLRDG